MKNITKYILAFLTFNFTFLITNAQVAINEDNSDPAPSAILDISSTDKGLLIPRMTTSEREEISTPAEGLMVYDEDTDSFWYYTNGWQEISPQTIDVLNLNGSTLEISLENDGESTKELELSGLESHLFQYESCTEQSIIAQSISNSATLGPTGWQSWTSTVDARLGRITVGTDILDAGTATLYEGEGITGNVSLLGTVDLEDGGTVADFTSLNINLLTGEKYTIEIKETSDFNFVWDCSRTDVYNGGITSEGSNKDYVFEVFVLDNCTQSSIFEQASNGDWNATFEEGNVGIGVTAPTERLEVDGTVSATAFVGDGSGLTNVGTDDQTIDKFELSGNNLLISLEGSGQSDISVDLTPLIDDLVPIGTIQMWPTATAPDGWLICIGQEIEESDYPELYQVLGGEDGRANLPNFKGRFPLGAGLSNANGATTHDLTDAEGEETVTLEIEHIPAHTHNITYGERSKGGSGNNVTDLDSSGKTETTSSAGGGEAHNNMPPFYTINFIIKAE